MTYDVLLPGFSLRLSNFLECFLLSTWSWKIDPWKSKAILNFSEKNTVQLLQETTPDIVLESFPVVCIEKIGFFERRVYQLPANETLWEYVRVCEKRAYLRFKVSPNWDKITLLTDITETKGCVAFEYLAQIMPGVCLKHDLLTFHSALVEYRGKAFAVCADSGTGKTTHARLWRDCKNALILNGDRTVCGRTEGRWTAYGTPWSGSSGEQINRSAPLEALVLLERSEVNYVQCLSGLEAFQALMPHLLYPSWDAELVGRAMELMDDLLANVRIYRLGCRPDSESVEVLCQAIFKE